MAIAFVNAGNGVNFGGGGFTAMAAGAVSLSAGNTLIASVRFYPGGSDPGAGAVTSVTDTAGNTYVRAVRTYAPPSNGSDVEIWYALNTTANASNVVTFNLNASYAYWEVNTAQYSGLATSGALDKTATGAANSTVVTSGAYTTTQADELLFAVMDYDSSLGQSWTPDTGYTLRGSNVCLAMEDKIVSAIQTGVTTSATLSTTRNLNIAVATFAATGGGGGGADQPTMRRWGGVPFMGGSVGNKGVGRRWGRTQDGLFIPRSCFA